MFEECRHIMPNGSKCHGSALRGKAFCHFHMRLRQVMSKAKQPENEQPIELPVLEDRSAIQLALAQVLNALGSSHLDPKRAGLFLYGLQIASQNVDHDCDILPQTAVGCTTHTTDGDELGPRCSRGFAPHDCRDCLQRNRCANYRLCKQQEDEEEDEDEEDSALEEDEEEDTEGEDEEAPAETEPITEDAPPEKAAGEPNEIRGAVEPDVNWAGQNTTPPRSLIRRADGISPSGCRAGLPAKANS